MWNNLNAILEFSQVASKKFFCSRNSIILANCPKMTPNWLYFLFNWLFEGQDKKWDKSWQFRAVRRILFLVGGACGISLVSCAAPPPLPPIICRYVNNAVPVVQVQAGQVKIWQVVCKEDPIKLSVAETGGKGARVVATPPPPPPGWSHNI